MSSIQSHWPAICVAFAWLSREIVGSFDFVTRSGGWIPILKAYFGSFDRSAVFLPQFHAKTPLQGGPI